MTVQSKDMFTNLVIDCSYDVYLRHILPLLTLKDMLSMRIVAHAYSVESDFVTFRDMMALQYALISKIKSSQQLDERSRAIKLLETRLKVLRIFSLYSRNTTWYPIIVQIVKQTKDLCITTRWNMVHFLLGNSRLNGLEYVSALKAHWAGIRLVGWIHTYSNDLMSMGSDWDIEHFEEWDDRYVNYDSKYFIFCANRLNDRLFRINAGDLACSQRSIGDINAIVNIFDDEEKLRLLLHPTRMDARLLRRRCIKCKNKRRMVDFPEPRTTKKYKKRTWNSTKPICMLCR